MSAGGRIQRSKKRPWTGERRRTDWNHALAVVVEIFLDNLEETLDGAARIGGVIGVNYGGSSGSIWGLAAAAEVLVLLLHLGKGGGEAADDTLVGGVVDVGLDEEAKVEYELIAQILSVRDDDGVAEDGVFAVGRVDGDVAVAEGLARDDVLLQDVKVDEAGAGRVFRGGDAAGG